MTDRSQRHGAHGPMYTIGLWILAAIASHTGPAAAAAQTASSAGAVSAAHQTAAPAGAGGPRFLAVEEVVAGMQGVGLTVVSGTAPTEFGVEILGVLHDLLPKLDLIVARLTGLGLEQSNVVAGMSGSPVYVDGRLLGAVAYRMVSFSHEAIAGIIPIGAMLAVADRDVDRPAVAGADPGRTQEILDLAAALATGTAQDRELAAMRAGSEILPIATPVSIAGMRPQLVHAMTPLFESLGWAPMMGGAGGSAEPITPNLEPGGAVAVQLMRGDVSVTASGTVTYRDGDRVLAFGHPFLQGGSVDFPMVGASVLTVLASSADSRKLSVTGTEVLGAVRQDRLPAILGVIGAEPRLVPVRLAIDSEHGRQTLAFELVSDPILTPLYLFLGLVNGVQSLEEVYGEGSIELGGEIVLGGDDPAIRFGNLYSSQNQAIVSLSSDLAGIFSVLYGNPLEPVVIRDVDLDIVMRRDRRSATIRRVWHDRSEVRPGDTVTIGIALQPYRGPEVLETLTFEVPDNVPSGPLTLLVGDAPSVDQEERSLLLDGAQPRSIEALVSRMNRLRRVDHLYLLATRPADGALVNGKALPALPPSVVGMLSSSRASGDVAPLRRAIVAEQRVPVAYAVSGSQRIELIVRRR